MIREKRGIENLSTIENERQLIVRLCFVRLIRYIVFPGNREEGENYSKGRIGSERNNNREKDAPWRLGQRRRKFGRKNRYQKSSLICPPSKEGGPTCERKKRNGVLELDSSPTPFVERGSVDE